MCYWTSYYYTLQGESAWQLHISERSIVLSAFALASVYTSTYFLALPLYISSMGADTTRCFSLSKVCWYWFIHIYYSYLCDNLCNSSVMVLKFHMNFQRYGKKPRNNWNYLTVAGMGHLFKLYIFESLFHIPSSVISKPRNIVLLHNKLHFLSLQ